MKIDQRFITGMLKTLVNIKSTSGAENEILSYLENEIKSWGAKTKRYKFSGGRYNLLARCGKGNPVLCLNAHADTVPQSGNSIPRARIRDGILYGLGACDTKGSLVAMMAVFKGYAVSQMRLNGALHLLISIDEERKSTGVNSVINQGYRCDYAIVGEPTNLEIVTQHMGQIMMSIQARGKSTHSSSPWKGINAIDRLMKVVSSIRCLVEDGKNIPGIGKQSMNLGAIHGGDIPNRVPDLCEALTDIRILPGTRNAEMLAKIDRICKRGVDVHYKVLKSGRPMSSIGDSCFIGVVRDGVRKTTRRPAVSKSMRFWTEAADFTNDLHAQTVVLGPGETRRAHSENEFIKLKEVFQAAEIYSSVACSLFSENRVSL